MNNSIAVFLLNPNVRAIQATYEAGDKAARTMFKTLDPNIKVDDLVIVPTDTRHNMTVCKVAAIDVEIDFDSSVPVQWVIGRIDPTGYSQVLQQEGVAISAIRSAELRKKREDLSKALFADNIETFKALPIAASGGDKPQE